MRHKFQSTFKDGNGRVVGTATTSDGVAGTISVYLAGTATVASVYTASSGGTAVNSVTTDTHGHFYFWVDEDDYTIPQKFKIVLSHSDFESKTYDNLDILMVSAATTSLAGIVELDTKAETIAGVGTTRAVTADGLAYALQRGTIQYVADTAANDTYVATLVPAIDDYVDGMVVNFKAKTANTGACTLNVNGKGAKAIKKHNDRDTATGDIEAGQIVTVIYDLSNTVWQMQSQLASESNVTAAANITANVPVIGDDGAKGVKKYVTNILNLVQISRSQFTYSDADQITCGAAQYMCKDKFCYWVSTITTVATGAAGGAEWWYLYLDYSAITSGTALTASELVWSTVAPTWNATYRQLMNGDDRCIFAVYTNAGNNILEFSHDGDTVMLADSVETQAAVDIDTTWTDIGALRIPGFATIGLVAWKGSCAAGVTFYWRTDGQTGTTGHYAIATSENSGFGIVITSSAQIIEMKASASDGSTTGCFTEGWKFPIGM